jgi:HD-GYP domain-containing protein (c-di-GMP phosphodiesterase class II)
MDLIELPKSQLQLGMTLKFTIRDENGEALLTKGQRILSFRQLEIIRSRKKIFVEIEESFAGINALNTGISTLNRLDAPIKDFSKHLRVDAALAELDALASQQAEEKLSGSLPERWGTMESKLGGLLASVATTENFESRIRALDQHIQDMLLEDATGTQLILFNRAVSDFSNYSVTHALLCAALVRMLAPIFKLSEKERSSLVCAALTMNIAMTRLQNALTTQTNVLSASQRQEIANHSTAGVQLLSNALVSDSMWLEVVSMHHAPLSGPEGLVDWSPVPRMTKILQVVDRYTAAMSPRKSRLSRTARDSALSVVVKTGAAKHDEVGSALIQLLGVYPPGTYVKLAGGETAVVISRGFKPVEPVVASVFNRDNQPIVLPRRSNTTSKESAVVSSLVASEVRINVKIAHLLRLIPR